MSPARVKGFTSRPAMSLVCTAQAVLSTSCSHNGLLGADRSGTVAGMRVWVDITNSPHVPFFRPLLGLLRQRGARGRGDHARLRADARVACRGTVSTTTSSARRTAGPMRCARRSRWPSGSATLRRWARGRRFDVALSHASHELPLTARTLGIPSAYAFDYEFARVQHGLGCRAATRVVVPDAIPSERLDRLGARRAKVRRYPGLKEEYYLAGFEPDPCRAGRPSASTGRACSSSCGRRPTSRSTTATAIRSSTTCCERLGTDPARPGGRAAPNRGAARAIAAARPAVARRPRARRRRPEPRRARRPRRLGGRDDEPRGGRARRPRLHDVRRTDRRGRRAPRPRAGGSDASTSADELELEKRTAAEPRPDRDPALLLDLMLTALEA